MLRIDHLLVPATPGAQLTVSRWHFGTPGARPRVYIQAALHADETPGILVAQQLRQRLEELEAAGQLCGEVILLPVANPIGLAQFHNGTHTGRFDGHSGRNFNRGFPDLVDAAAGLVSERLTDSLSDNRTLIRQALVKALQQRTTPTQIDALQYHLFGLALECDLVLDLHCDSEADVHLYAHSQQLATAEALGACLGAAAVLYANEQGGQSFDDALTRQWFALQHRFPNHPIVAGCTAMTVELRGQFDVDTRLATQDVDGIVRFLAWYQAIRAPLAPLPTIRYRSTPLNRTEVLLAPVSGVVHYTTPTGVEIEAGALLAELIDPVSGETHAMRSQGGGMYYARLASRYVAAGTEVCFIAGDTMVRDTDQLLAN